MQQAAVADRQRPGRSTRTRLRPSTLTFGRALSRMTCSTVPVCPLSLPAMIMTVSPRTIFHRPVSNMGLMYRPLPL